MSGNYGRISADHLMDGNCTLGNAVRKILMEERHAGFVADHLLQEAFLISSILVGRMKTESFQQSS